VSTILGTKASLEGVDFNLGLYLELTIDANADGQISVADPPLLPRQSILPAVFAKESANSQLLDGYDWSPLFGNNNPADGTLLPSKIADSSLTSAKISDGAVTTGKIPDGAVTPSKLDVTGASAGQSLVYNGNEVIWSSVNALDATLLNGFDWTALFNNGNPSTGELNVANMRSRGNLFVNGGATLNGSLQIALPARLIAPSVGINMFLNDWGLYLRGVGDFNHYLLWGNAHGNQSGFDGPVLVGLGGGVLGTTENWSLRWNSTGTVQTRGAISSGSDRNLKENFAAVNADDVLASVASLPITRWNYKDDPVAQHIGPVAQDFRAAFGLGSDDKFIATVDADGVALAAIQGLNNKVDQRNNELLGLVRKQQEQIEALRAEIAALRAAKP
jgi:hypothetical protein